MTPEQIAFKQGERAGEVKGLTSSVSGLRTEIRSLSARVLMLEKLVWGATSVVVFIELIPDLKHLFGG